MCVCIHMHLCIIMYVYIKLNLQGHFKFLHSSPPAASSPGPSRLRARPDRRDAGRTPSSPARVESW